MAFPLTTTHQNNLKHRHIPQVVSHSPNIFLTILHYAAVVIKYVLWWREQPDSLGKVKIFLITSLQAAWLSIGFIPICFLNSEMGPMKGKWHDRLEKWGQDLGHCCNSSLCPHHPDPALNITQVSLSAPSLFPCGLGSSLTGRLFVPVALMCTIMAQHLFTALTLGSRL